MTTDSERYQGIIDKLVDAGLLTRNQAESYVYRKYSSFDRAALEGVLGRSRNTVDNEFRAARDKIESARETLDILD